MASRVTPTVPMGDAEPDGAALQHRPWRNRDYLSSGLAGAEQFLANSVFDRGPWGVVALAAGIAAWFVLQGPMQWLGLISGCLALAVICHLTLGSRGRFPYLHQSLIVILCAVAGGTSLVWGKAALVGTPPIARPTVAVIEGRLLQRDDQPAEHRVRLLLATREPETARAIMVRVNLDLDQDRHGIAPGAILRLRARLVPPAPPMLPGGYDFARSAWFAGLAATGSVLGPVTLVAPTTGGGWLQRLQSDLSHHVRSHLGGSSGTIAAAFASGDRGAIAQSDEDAMRDAGLTHLLSISGLHVSAVIAATYVLVLRLLALFPWLALRTRLPLVAAGGGAGAGIAYTLLTGSEVPTIRSCVGALLVLAALALGREALSMRMVAIGALAILLVWPEALVGPSFQMSFAAVIAIVALHGAAPVRALFAIRDEPWWVKGVRSLGSLLLTGVVIELALLPIGLFHFHRAGIYGALANVIAIPLTTFVSMPMIALALLFDAAGLGAPFWWAAGKSLDLLLALAHWTASRPGAVTLLPAMGGMAIGLFVFGGLWLALWHGRVRLLGLVPAAIGTVLLIASQPPDVLISGDGRHVGLTGEGPELLVLRESRSAFAHDNLTELSGMAGEVRLLSDWPGARCNRDFCMATISRGGRPWQLLIALGKDMAPERELAAACERVDVVIAPRYLPRSCQPRWLKIDRRMLDRTGGVTLDLERGTYRTVASEEGRHGWWQPQMRTYRSRPQAMPAETPGRPEPPVQAARSDAGQ